MTKLVLVTRPDGKQYLAKTTHASGKDMALTDENCSECCGENMCEEAVKFVACSNDFCGDEPDHLWVCVEPKCDQIKWGDRCYQKSETVEKVTAIPDGEIILQSGMYECVDGCADPACASPCPRYRQASMCNLDSGQLRQRPMLHLQGHAEQLLVP